MKRPSSDTARRAGLIAVAAALAAAIAAAGTRLAGRSRRAAHQHYTCDCGAVYRVTGLDRHRVYWPADAPAGAPVLGDRCTSCDAPLPSGRANGAERRPAVAQS
jgi:hypothetical protein